MHALDDSEVYYANKERRLSPEEQERYHAWKKEFSQAFEKQFGYLPKRTDLPDTGHRTLLSTEKVFANKEDGSYELTDSSWIQECIASDPMVLENCPQDRVNELMTIFTPRERQVYFYYFRKGITNMTKIGDFLHLSRQRIREILDHIEKKILEDPELKRFYRNTDSI